MALAAIALSGAAHGCSAPTAPPSPPGGGQTLHLSFEAFALTVEPVLARQGCDAGGDCHGAGIRGALRLSPQAAKDVRFDYDQVVLETFSSLPESSLILTKPLALAAGGTPHGVKPFASTADSDYQAIRQWVMSGVSP